MSKNDLVKMLQEDNSNLKEAGCNLAEASLKVIRDYDGIHRLSLAVSKWFLTLTNQGNRKQIKVKNDDTEGLAETLSDINKELNKQRFGRVHMSHDKELDDDEEEAQDVELGKIILGISPEVYGAVGTNKLEIITDGSFWVDSTGILRRDEK